MTWASWRYRSTTDGEGLTAMAHPRVQKLMEDVRQRHPRSVRGIEEARAVDPGRLDLLSERFLNWLATAGARPASATPSTPSSVSPPLSIWPRPATRPTGTDENKTYEECYKGLYNQKE